MNLLIYIKETKHVNVSDPIKKGNHAFVYILFLTDLIKFLPNYSDMFF